MLALGITGTWPCLPRLPDQDMLNALSEEIEEPLIPVAYGGPSTLPLYETPQECELRALVDKLNGSAAVSSGLLP